MKKRILIIIIIGIIATFFIYQLNKHEKIYFLSLGDGLATGMTAYNIEGYNYNDYIRDDLEKKEQLEEFIHEFSKTDQTVENLIITIENNYELEELDLTIQQALAKSKLITLAIGNDELANFSLKSNLTTKEKENYINNMKKLLKLIRNFNDNKIFLIGIYKVYNLKQEDVDYFNENLKQIAQELQLEFIDISSLSEKKEYFSSNNSYYFNYKGHQDIANKIIKKLE